MANRTYREKETSFGLHCITFILLCAIDLYGNPSPTQPFHRRHIRHHTTRTLPLFIGPWIHSCFTYMPATFREISYEECIQIL